VPDQPPLLEIPEQPAPEPPSPSIERADLANKYIRINREQMQWMIVDLEQLIPADHKARAVWELTGQLDLRAFEEHTKSKEGEVGRPGWSPRLLVSVWLYGYSEGVTSARALSRMMQFEPALQWLTGLEEINHHTLSSFRVNRKEELDGLFVELLHALDTVKVISLERVMHDGTKVRARAGVDSFGHEHTVAEKLAAIKELVKEDPQSETSKRQERARERAQRERQQRVEQAQKELEKIQQARKAEEKRKQARVSLTEPEARMMKHGDHAIAPSYNMQVSTEAKAGVILGVDLTQSAEDSAALDPAMDQIRKNLGREPKQVVADGGFTNRQTIEKLEHRKIDFIGSLPDPKDRSEAAMKAAGIDPQYAPHFFVFQPESQTMQCPAGKQLPYVGQSRKRGNHYRQYRAAGADCQSCTFQPQCCPRAPWKGRTVSRLEAENEVVARFRTKMATEEAQTIYRQRGAVAEFPFAWIKERCGVRKFRVFGMAKARTEAVWACLAYNAMIWKRLVWAKALPQAA
jgi:transposase